LVVKVFDIAGNSGVSTTGSLAGAASSAMSVLASSAAAGSSAAAIASTLVMRPSITG
jgi:hypothetical protein